MRIIAPLLKPDQPPHVLENALSLFLKARLNDPERFRYLEPFLTRNYGLPDDMPGNTHRNLANRIQFNLLKLESDAYKARAFRRLLQSNPDSKLVSGLPALFLFISDQSTRDSLQREASGLKPIPMEE